MTTPPNRNHQHGGVEAVGAVEQPILSGADPGDPEHWEDLAGYPLAVMREPQP